MYFIKGVIYIKSVLFERQSVTGEIIRRRPPRRNSSDVIESILWPVWM